MTASKITIPCPHCAGRGTMPAVNTTLAQRARALRARAGKTATEISKLTNGRISSNNIGNIERGQNTNPSSQVAVALATALGTTVDFLLQGKGPETDPDIDPLS